MPPPGDYRLAPALGARSGSSDAPQDIARQGPAGTGGVGAEKVASQGFPGAAERFVGSRGRLLHMLLWPLLYSELLPGLGLREVFDGSQRLGQDVIVHPVEVVSCNHHGQVSHGGGVP